jgi:hypothetical protein
MTQHRKQKEKKTWLLHAGSKNTVFWDVFMAVSMKDVFWDFVPCALVRTDVPELERFKSLQRLRHLFNEVAMTENKVIHTTGNFTGNTLIRNMHNAVQIPYTYNDITNLSRQQAQVFHNHENSYIRNTGQGKAQHRKYKRIKLGGSQAYDS